MSRSRYVRASPPTIENLNKDDNQVGVRAVDEDGNRSPVAFASR